jgi:hypothetical protein
MTRLFGLVQIMAMSLTLPQSLPGGGFEGRIITQSGSPLADATVVLLRKNGGDIESGIEVATDENGIFHLKETPEALFVQKQGFLPVLYRVDENDRSPLVVMNDVPPEPRVPLAVCAGQSYGKRVLLIGPDVEIITEEKVKVKAETDPADPTLPPSPTVTTFSYPHKKRETMTIVMGGHVVFIGNPHVDVLAQTDAIAVRGGGADISGTTRTGKHWRWAFLHGAPLRHQPPVSPQPRPHLICTCISPGPPVGAHFGPAKVERVAGAPVVTALK